MRDRCVLAPSLHPTSRVCATRACLSLPSAHPFRVSRLLDQPARAISSVKPPQTSPHSRRQLPETRGSVQYVLPGIALRARQEEPSSLCYSSHPETACLRVIMHGRSTEWVEVTADDISRPELDSDLSVDKTPDQPCSDVAKRCGSPDSSSARPGAYSVASPMPMHSCGKPLSAHTRAV